MSKHRLESPRHEEAPIRRGMTARNVVVTSGIRAAALFLTILTPVVATHVLGRTAVAIAMVAVSVSTIVGVVGQIGIPWMMSFRVAQVRSGHISVDLLRRNQRSASLFLLALSAVLVLAAVAPFGIRPAWIVPGGSRSLVLAVVLGGMGRATSKVYSEVSKGYGHVNVSAVASDFVGPAAGVLVILVGSAVVPGRLASAVSFSWALGFGWLAAAGFAWLWMPVKPRLSLPPADHGAEYRLRTGMVVLGLISILNVGIQQIHVVISGFVLPLVDSAQFSTAARLATLTGAPLMIVTGLASPDIGVALQSKDPGATRLVEARLRRLTGLLFVAGSALCLVYVVAGSDVLSLLYGRAYAGGHWELVVLSIGPLASLYAGVAGLSLMLAGERIALLRDTVLGSIGAIVAMVIGVEYWHSMGLSIGYTVGQILTNALLLRSCRSRLGFTPIASPLALLRKS